MKRPDSSLRCLLGLTIAFLHLGYVQSVIMPPFHSSNPGPPALAQRTHSANLFFYDDDVEVSPYVLSINEGEAVEVGTRSQSFITINLNQPVPQIVDVEINVLSGANLVTFDSNPSNNSSNLNSKTTIYISYPVNECGDRVVKFYTQDLAGHAEIVCTVVRHHNVTFIDDSSAYISVNIRKSRQLSIVINIVGWIYFLAWSLSFYFQVILNFRRKSVIGLNFDFLALNILGFTCYSIFNLAFLFSRQVQKEYYQRKEYSRIPVEYNDLFFAVHAFTITLVTVIQCFLYERGAQKISIPAGFFIVLVSLCGFGMYCAHLFQAVAILDVVMYLSYVKLAVTIIKYTPQAYMNYQRKATSGWSIHNILLDFTGGVLSLAQMLFLAYNYNDWVSIFGNFTKFGLGITSIAFDVIFVVQHYILYRHSEQLEVSTDSVPGPIISQSIRSGNIRQQETAERSAI